MQEYDLSKYLGKPVSELPAGATGCQAESEEKFLNELADSTNVQIIEGEELMKLIQFPATYSIPPTLNTLEWWKVFNQGPIGSCFPAGTLVTLGSGELVPIEEIKYGNFVRTHKGRVRQVVDTMSRLYTGTMVEVFVKGWDKINATADHLFWINDKEWVRADQIKKGDMVSLMKNSSDSLRTIDLADHIEGPLVEDDGYIAIPGSTSFVQRHLPLDEITCKTLGLYCAEGSTDTAKGNLGVNRAIFTVHELEQNSIDLVKSFCERLGISCSLYEKNESKAVNIRVNSSMMARFFQSTCGRFANKKHVPAFLLNASVQQKLWFVQGFFMGDGSVAILPPGEKNKTTLKKHEANSVCVAGTQLQVSVASASRELIQQISTMMCDAGLKPGRSVSSRKSHQRFDSFQAYLYGKDCEAVCGIEYDLSSRRRPRKLAEDKNLPHCQLREVRQVTHYEVENLKVYDFEVDEDHSFTAQGMAVHNCLGCADAQTATGVHWLRTGGQRVEFSKFGHYITIQMVGKLLGKDVGSIPSDAVKVAANIGYCPEVWSEHLEELFKNTYGEASKLRPGQVICPAYPRNYRDGLRDFRAYLDDVKNPNTLRRKIMHMFKMQRFVRITKTDQIVQAKRAGIGFIQQSSLWSRAFDSHPTRIDTIGGSLHPQHGGHAYQILDISPSGEPVLGNTWGPGDPDNPRAPGWGDEGAKTMSVEAEQQILDHKFSITFLKTDMEFGKIIPRKPPRIELKPSSWA